MVLKDQLTVIGFDLGNTNLTAAVVTAQGQVLARWRRANPRQQGAQASLQVVEKMLRQAVQAYPFVQAVGIGFGGPVQAATGEIRRSHHTEGWEGLRLADWARERSGLAVWVDNDANAGGLGEALFGAGRGAHSLLYVNVGTGIGGAVVVGGVVHHGAHSNAGEIGHMVLTPEEGPWCTCGKRGCLEAWASGEALGRAAKQALAAEAGQGSKLRYLPVTQITGCAVSQAAREGDAVALQVLRQAGHYLGLALAAVCNVLDPELVIIGGGVSEGNAAYLEAAEEALKRYGTLPVAASIRLVPAALGYEAGVVGAAAVALQGLGGVE